jgi:ABC-type transporter lipoprotein component MlaA
MMPSPGGILRGVSAAILVATFSACASHRPGQPQFRWSEVQTGASNNPMEEAIRSVVERNQKLNHAVIYLAAKTYRDTVPEPARDSIDALPAFRSNST